VTSALRRRIRLLRHAWSPVGEEIQHTHPDRTHMPERHGHAEYAVARVSFVVSIKKCMEGRNGKGTFERGGDALGVGGR